MELFQIQMLLAKVESTPGTDASPTAASNNIPIKRGMVIEPDGEAIVRDIADGGFAQVPGLTSMKTMTFKVVLELRGNRTNGSAADISSGSISNALDFDPILRSADLAATYVAAGGTRDGMVIYQPSIPTDEGVTLTVYGYSQTKVYKAVGCKAAITRIAYAPGKITLLEVELRGSFSEIADATFPTTGVWPSTVPPVWAVGQVMNGTSVTFGYPPGSAALIASAGNYKGDRIKLGGSVPSEFDTDTWYYVVGNMASNGASVRLGTTLNGSEISQGSAGSSVTATSAGGFWLDGWTGAVCGGVNFSLGQQLTPREDGSRSSGLKGFMISGRQPSGDFTIESVTEATHPLWADWAAGTVKTLRVNCGAIYPAGTGNRYVIEAKVRLGKPSYSDASGKRMMNCPFTLVQSAPGTIDGSEFRLIFQ